MYICNFNPYHDEKGRFCSGSEAKIKSLEEAFQKVKAGSNEEIVRNIRDDLEQYGGTNDVALVKGNSKGGVEHIDGKHREDLSGIFKALVDGKITLTVPKRKVFIEHNGYRAVLSLDMFGNAKTWLLTGYKIKETSVENSEVCTHSAPMQFKPTFSRQELGADVSNKNIVDNEGGKILIDIEDNSSKVGSLSNLETDSISIINNFKCFFNPKVTENNDIYVSRYDRLKAGEEYFRIK